MVFSELACSFSKTLLLGVHDSFLQASLRVGSGLGPKVDHIKIWQKPVKTFKTRHRFTAVSHIHTHKKRVETFSNFLHVSLSLLIKTNM